MLLGIFIYAVNLILGMLHIFNVVRSKDSAQVKVSTAFIALHFALAGFLAGDLVGG